MAAIGAIVGLIGTGLQFMGSMQQASAAKAQANYNARLKEEEGKTALASKQREMLKEQQEQRLADSRVRALAASSGAGGAETGSVSDTLSDIAEAGDYNSRAVLFSGLEAQRMGDASAALYRAKGKSDYNNTLLQGIGSAASGFAKFYG